MRSFPVLALSVSFIIGMVSAAAILVLRSYSGDKLYTHMVYMVVEIACSLMAFVTAVASVESAVCIMVNAYFMYRTREVELCAGVKQTELRRNVYVKSVSIDSQAPAVEQLAKLASAMMMTEKEEEDVKEAPADQAAADSSIAAPSSDTSEAAASPSFDGSVPSKDAADAAPCSDALSGASTAVGPV